MKKTREELIDEFIRDLEVFDLEFGDCTFAGKLPYFKDHYMYIGFDTQEVRYPVTKNECIASLKKWQITWTGGLIIMSKRIQKFDVKIGSITTPEYLSRVFQYCYMKNTLGVNYDSYSGNYVARGANDEGFDVKSSDEIVYLGFGQWKKKENK